MVGHGARDWDGLLVCRGDTNMVFVRLSLSDARRSSAHNEQHKL